MPLIKALPTGTVVGDTDTQTLTNKSIDSATNTITGKQLVGTATNDSASAGNIGEFIDSGLITTSTSLTSGVAINATSISLTAGDWDVWGVIGYTGDPTTTVGALAAAINTTSATIPTNGSAGFSQPTFSNGTAFAARNAMISSGVRRVSVSSTTTVYLVARADFSTSTCTLNNCQLSARRRR